MTWTSAGSGEPIESAQEANFSAARIIATVRRDNTVAATARLKFWVEVRKPRTSDCTVPLFLSAANSELRTQNSELASSHPSRFSHQSRPSRWSLVSAIVAETRMNNGG
jgi:hypothetical protein